MSDAVDSVGIRTKNTSEKLLLPYCQGNGLELAANVAIRLERKNVGRKLGSYDVFSELREASRLYTAGGLQWGAHCHYLSLANFSIEDGTKEARQ